MRKSRIHFGLGKGVRVRRECQYIQVVYRPPRNPDCTALSGLLIYLICSQGVALGWLVPGRWPGLACFRALPWAGLFQGVGLNSDAPKALHMPAQGKRGTSAALGLDEERAQP